MVQCVKMNVEKSQIEHKGEYYETDKSCAKMFDCVYLPIETKRLDYSPFFENNVYYQLWYAQKAFSDHQEYPTDLQLFVAQPKWQWKVQRTWH